MIYKANSEISGPSQKKIMKIVKSTFGNPPFSSGAIGLFFMLGHKMADLEACLLTWKKKQLKKLKNLKQFIPMSVHYCKLLI